MIQQRLSHTDAAPLTMREALSTIGIKPWSESGIKAYMKTEQAKYRPNAWYYVDSFFNADAIERLASALGWIGFFALISTVLTAVAGGPLQGLLSLAASLVIIGASVSLFYLSGKMWRGLFSHITVKGYASWLPHSIEVYGLQQVPPLGRAAVEKTKALFPGARFYVDDLKQGEWSLDPVLWAVLQTDQGVERVALYVWDKFGNTVFPQ